MSDTDFTPKLLSLMQQAGVSSFKALSRNAGVSEHQILQLRRGKLGQMRLDILIKLSQVLRIDLSELIVHFSHSADNSVVPPHHIPQNVAPQSEFLQEIADLKTEYERLQVQLEQQQQLLMAQFQESSLQLLESLLLQFPTAAFKAQENPELAAVKILPLVQKPLEKLLLAWGVEAIAPVGSSVPYNPQLHQLMESTAQVGESVKVRYTGYRQGDKLLYRAKVSVE